MEEEYSLEYLVEGTLSHFIIFDVPSKPREKIKFCNVPLRLIDCYTSLYQTKEDFLKDLGIETDTDLYITHNNSRKENIPILFYSGAFRDVITARIENRKKVIKKFEKEINNSADFLKYLIKQKYLKGTERYVKINSYKELRDICYYYDEFYRIEHFYFSIIFSKVKHGLQDMSEEEKKFVNFVCSMDIQELLDFNLIEFKYGKYLSLVPEQELPDKYIECKESKTKGVKLYHDPTGMFCGNMVGGDNLYIQPDGTIKKKRRY